MKIRDVVVLDEAAKDLHDACDFYDRIESGAGDYCWDRIIEDIESLSHNAGIHSKHYGYYRMFSKRFPHAVYYEIRKETVRVVAIIPMKRDPKWIEFKMRSRKLSKD